MRTTRNGLHVMNALMQPSETGRGAAAVRGRQLASRLPAAAARFLRPAAVVAAAGLLVTALAPLTASASASRPSAAWRLGGPPVPVLRWRSCDGGFQCATARVPLDYRHPRGAAIRIAMMRHRATSPARRIGSLFFNSGGPSEQIDDFPAEYAGFPPAVRARFDILTFDPRGFGYSTAVRCSRVSAISRWRRMLTMRFAITKATNSITPSVNRYSVSSTSKLNSGGTKK